MPFFTDPPLHDFPDRAHRLLLEHPDNLRDLVGAVAPDLVGGFAFDRMRRLDRALDLPDWRRRESDLLFAIPYQGPMPSPGVEPSVLVCLLVEHQSQEDQSMPLRTLLYAVLYWDREWKAWEERRQRGEPLRLSPVLPIVFHTGREPWATHRTFADLFTIPEPFRPYVVSWQPLFWDLAAQSSDALRQASGEWLRAMAVVRAERENADTYRTILSDVLHHLEPLHERDQVRWHDVLWFLLSWSVRRRPGTEHAELIAAAKTSHENVALRREVETVSQFVGLSWEEEMAQKAQQKAAAVALATCRENLRAYLEERFGTLPDALLQRIEQTEDIGRLKACVRQSVHITKLDELSL